MTEEICKALRKRRNSVFAGSWVSLCTNSTAVAAVSAARRTEENGPSRAAWKFTRRCTRNRQQRHKRRDLWPAITRIGAKPAQCNRRTWSSNQVQRLPGTRRQDLWTRPERWERPAARMTAGSRSRTLWHQTNVGCHHPPARRGTHPGLTLPPMYCISQEFRISGGKIFAIGGNHRIYQSPL